MTAPSAEIEATRRRVMDALRLPLDGDNSELDALARGSLRMAFENHIAPHGLTPTTVDCTFPHGEADRP